MGRHFACSDLHGMWNLWQKIGEYCNDDDVIFFLGDAIDRGTDGLKLMKALIKDKRVQYIKGNHEDMLVNAFYNSDFFLVALNGGNSTIKDFEKLSDDSSLRLIHKLENLPKEIEYINPDGIRIIMNHSGYNQKQPILNKKEDPYIWNRSQITCPWKGDNKTLIVHGHTPTPFLIQKLNETGNFFEVPKDVKDISVINYCNGHKLDIDLGSFETGKAALLDLDTLKVQYFTNK